MESALQHYWAIQTKNALSLPCLTQNSTDNVINLSDEVSLLLCFGN